VFEYVGQKQFGLSASTLDDTAAVSSRFRV